MNLSPTSPQDSTTSFVQPVTSVRSLGFASSLKSAGPCTYGSDSTFCMVIVRIGLYADGRSDIIQWAFSIAPACAVDDLQDLLLPQSEYQDVGLHGEKGYASSPCYPTNHSA